MNTNEQELSVFELEQLRKARQMQKSIILLQEAVDDMIGPIVRKVAGTNNLDRMQELLQLLDDGFYRSELRAIMIRKRREEASGKITQVRNE